jgi:hypothetical protein
VVERAPPRDPSEGINGGGRLDDAPTMSDFLDPTRGRDSSPIRCGSCSCACSVRPGSGR